MNLKLKNLEAKGEEPPPPPKSDGIALEILKRKFRPVWFRSSVQGIGRYRRVEV